VVAACLPSLGLLKVLLTRWWLIDDRNVRMTPTTKQNERDDSQRKQSSHAVTIVRLTVVCQRYAATMDDAVSLL